MSQIINLQLRIGIDKRYDCTILNTAKTEVVEITGWALSWLVKRRWTDTDASAVLTKTTAAGGITIKGIFNANPALNTQLARVAIADDDTDLLAERAYVYELRRTDAGFETPLIEGSLSLTHAAS